MHLFMLTCKALSLVVGSFLDRCLRYCPTSPARLDIGLAAGDGEVALSAPLEFDVPTDPERGFDPEYLKMQDTSI